MADEKHKIRNAVIASLTTAAIVSFVVYLIPGGWAWIVSEVKKVVSALITWFGSSIAVPAWLVVLLSLMAIITVIGVAVIAMSVMRSSDDRTESFTEADFFGIKWRWRYGQHGVHSITSYCPVCDLQVYPCSASAYDAVDRIVYRCDNGHWESKEFDGSQSEIENRIEREIHRYLRQKNEDRKKISA